MNQTILTAIILGLAAAAAQTSFAKDIKIATYREDIKPYVRAADVWQRPEWIDKNLRFTYSPDLINGPKAKGYTKALVGNRNNRVECQTAEDDQNRDFGGKTPKFYCQLLERTSKGLKPVTKDNGERRVIKIKYHPPGKVNNEVPGEILGTRLLWALGFGADQMFFMDRVTCHGCSHDPFKDRRVVSGSSVHFDNVTIERKIDADELLSPVMISTRDGGGKKVWDSGIKFREMMENLPVSPEARQTQLARRDALRLLAVFMQHTDLKNDNQRFICLKTNKAGQCLKPFMMIQDIGTSFGTRIASFKLDKVHLRTFRDTPVWKNPRKCEARIASNFIMKGWIRSRDSTMSSPEISEAGRQFLARLLMGFIKDKERVRDLFRAAHIEERGREESIEDWVNAFVSRVHQIANPTGDPNFRCPKTKYEAPVGGLY